MTKLDEQQLARVLQHVVPERDPAPGLAERSRKLAAQRRRRRFTAMGGMAVLVMAIVIPTVVLLHGGGPDLTPTASGPSADHSPGTAACGRACQSARVLAAIKRPLHLPTVAPGESCPVSPSRALPGGAGFSGRFRALGGGPLFLAGLSTRNPTVVALTRDSRHWLTSKVIWVFGHDYKGPVLLRGGRIDAAGPLRFAHYLGAAGYSESGPGDGPHRQLLYVRGGLNAAGYGGPKSEPSAVYARAGGCYAIQIDGVGFSQTLVFEARASAHSAK